MVEQVMEKTRKKLGASELKTLRDDGVVRIKNFFSKQEIFELRGRVERLRPVAGEHVKPSRRWVLTSPSHARRLCASPAVQRDIVGLSDLAIERDFRNFSNSYYGISVCLDHIMSIESPPSNEAITAWHCDANTKADNLLPTDRFTLKFFLYLNDIDASNGAFAYAPGTHHLVTALRGAFITGAVGHHWVARFPDVRDALAVREIKTWVEKNVPGDHVRRYLEASEKTNCGEAGCTEFDQTGKAGTLVIFDDRGVHRGGIPKSGHRSILRYNYIPTRYWKQQFTPVRYAANRFFQLLLLPKSVSAHW